MDHALVHPEEIADLAGAHADVARGDIGVLADVAVQLHHQRLAEAHHFPVRLALGVEIRSTLGASHGKPRQRVLEATGDRCPAVC